MANGIPQPNLVSIQELLSGTDQFSVPPYQRNFAWGKDETQELWEDIMFAANNADEDYFLGTIVLRREGRTSYEIIDGQQRLTCLSMIFSCSDPQKLDK